MSAPSITPRQFSELIQSGTAFELIDVRTPAEFREIHIDCARNVPLDRLDAAALATRRSQAEGPLYVICRSGGRSTQACERLLAAGLSNVVSIEGGTQAWDKAGLPVVRGAKAISLERQVRMAAGTLVLTGAALGAFVSPYWIGLAAFVGAGLLYSGISDTCGMAMILARMPWNQDSRPTPTDNAATSTNPTVASTTTCCR